MSNLNLKLISAMSAILLTSSIIYASSNSSEAILLNGVSLSEPEDEDMTPIITSNPGVFAAAFERVYNEMANSVSGVCSNTSDRECVTFEAEISAAGFVSVKAIIHFYYGD